jgi:hypothetical protein
MRSLYARKIHFECQPEIGYLDMFRDFTQFLLDTVATVY